MQRKWFNHWSMSEGFGVHEDWMKLCGMLRCGLDVFANYLWDSFWKCKCLFNLQLWRIFHQINFAQQGERCLHYNNCFWGLFCKCDIGRDNPKLYFMVEKMHIWLIFWMGFYVLDKCLYIHSHMIHWEVTSNLIIAILKWMEGFYISNYQFVLFITICDLN